MLPRVIDNHYRGHKAALWLFGFLIFSRSMIGLRSIFAGYDVASSADGIPLSTFPVAAANEVVSDFALLGIANLMLMIVCLVVLIRYRSAVPFMFALLLVEFTARKIALQLLPIARTGTPPGVWVSLILLAVMLSGFVLSLITRRNAVQAELAASS